MPAVSPTRAATPASSLRRSLSGVRSNTQARAIPKDLSPFEVGEESLVPRAAGRTHHAEGGARATWAKGWEALGAARDQLTWIESEISAWVESGSPGMS